MSQSETYILGHFIVAGLSHREPGSIPWSKINQETAIRLVRERFNPHDFEAVSVALHDGTLLGYLRRDDNRIPAALMDQGASLAAKISYLKLNREGNPAELRVEVTLQIEMDAE